MSKNYLIAVGLCLAWNCVSRSRAEDTPTSTKSAAERGLQFLREKSLTPAIVTQKGYEQLWQQWGVQEKPKHYAQAVGDRYGLFEAPYENHGLPLGLRPGSALFAKGVSFDCFLCHAGRVAGQTVLGLGNNALDLEALFHELVAADGAKMTAPYAFSRVRGTTEATSAAVYFAQYRDLDLNVIPPKKYQIHDSVCEDVPAWWLLKRKKTMYATGSADARAVRPTMSFMLSPMQSGEFIKQHEKSFHDLKAYTLSLSAPKYPFAIDTNKAKLGREIFQTNCASCHGSYGPEGQYPNKVVSLTKVGTDPALATQYDPKVNEFFQKSWLGQERDSAGKPLATPEYTEPGYQAPPLDGVWATAPYFHNGAVPTLAGVLNSKVRPKVFTRSYRAEKEDYDQEKVGLKYTEVPPTRETKEPARELRKIYDTTQPGRSNQGHTFGDALTDLERAQLLEYLKTL